MNFPIMGAKGTFAILRDKCWHISPRERARGHEGSVLQCLVFPWKQTVLAYGTYIED